MIYPNRSPDAQIGLPPAGAWTSDTTGGPLPFYGLAPVLVAILAHLPALGAYWNQDDWGQLARAADLTADGGLPVRWVSQVLFWKLLYPLFGLNPQPYAWFRLLLHGGGTWFVTRIAARTGQGPLARLLVGLLFAATPVVVVPLYWASGIQELIGAFFALVAIERSLALIGPGGRRRWFDWAACLIPATVSILAKENGLLLPVFLAVLLLGTRRLRTGPRPGHPGAGAASVMLVVLLAIACVEAVLVWNHFGHGPGQPYALGRWSTPFLNLAGYGWWLLSPGPFFASKMTPLVGLAGGAFWVLWTTWSIWLWRRGRPQLAACLLGSLLALAPVLPLATHLYPYFLYLPAAGVFLAAGFLLPRRWRGRPLLVTGLVLLFALVTFGSMTMRIKARRPDGLPSDPVVLRTAVSFEAARTLAAVPWQAGRPSGSRDGGSTGHRLILLQPARSRSQADLADKLGESWVAGSLLYSALGGRDGPRLILPDSVTTTWANNLSSAAPEAFVVVEEGPFLRFWGRTPEALLQMTVAEVARGHFRSAAVHLQRAVLLAEGEQPFLFDQGRMTVTVEELCRQVEPFFRYLADWPRPGAGPAAAGSLEDLFRWLVEDCLPIEETIPEPDRPR